MYRTRNTAVQVRPVPRARYVQVLNIVLALIQVLVHCTGTAAVVDLPGQCTKFSTGYGGFTTYSYTDQYQYLQVQLYRYLVLHLVQLLHLLVDLLNLE